MSQLIVPHYWKVVSLAFASFVPVLAYGVLTGKRIPSSLGTSLPTTMPWMFISSKDYWCLCCNSILSCRADPDGHIFCCSNNMPLILHDSLLLIMYEVQNIVSNMFSFKF